MHYPLLLEKCLNKATNDEVMYLGLFHGKDLYWGSDRYLFLEPNEVDAVDEYYKSDTLGFPIFPKYKVGDQISLGNELLKVVAIAPLLPPYVLDFHVVLQNQEGKVVQLFEEGYILPEYLDGTAWKGLF